MSRYFVKGSILFIWLLALPFLFATPTHADVESVSRFWPTAAVLDQGLRPQCVAYSLATYLEAQPHGYQGIQIPSPQLIYDGAQARDQWSDIPHDGSTLEAGFQYLQDYGYIDSVTFTSNVDYIQSYLMTSGPVEMGTIWTYAMTQPDMTGKISVADLAYAYLRYHAWVIYGWDDPTQSFWAQGTYGANFGVYGHFRITKADLITLLGRPLTNPQNREAGLAYKSAVLWLQRQLGNW